MKKCMIVFFMASMLLLFSGIEESFAAPVERNAEVESVSVEELGGLQQPIIRELDDGMQVEIYQESKNLQKGSAVYKSQWDSYSSNYYYNLLSEDEQAYWDKLDAMCYEYLIGTENLISQKDADGNLVYPTKSAMYAGFSKQKALNIALMFKYSNPQYYFLDIGVYSKRSGTNGTITFTVFPAFANGADRAAATAQMKSVIDSWLVQIQAQPDDLSKEKMAHDLICSKVVYDEGYENPALEMNVYNQVAYSVFCTDSTVCAGYSQAMQLLMNAVGIDCAVVTSQEHEWNIIRLNGTWYYLDLTWNDRNGEDGYQIAYKYFNRSHAAFMVDVPKMVRFHTTEPMWYGLLPELIYDSGATMDSYGSIHTPTVTLAEPQIIANGNVVTITAPTGGTIYYTTDGTSPGIAFYKADRYTGAFLVNGTTNIKAIAVANGCFDSGVSETMVVPQYTVTFDANGGYMGDPSVTVTSNVWIHGSVISHPAVPVRSGYTFLGWYTQKNGGTKIGDEIQIMGNTAFYAQWAKIKPKKAVITSLKNSAAKTMKVKIKPIDSANGYQIRYSLKKGMGSSKRTTVNKSTSTINKLKKGKTYYVQVRMYQKDSATGKTIYGAWSNKKSVKIKK